MSVYALINSMFTHCEAFQKYSYRIRQNFQPVELKRGVVANKQLNLITSPRVDLEGLASFRICVGSDYNSIWCTRVVEHNGTACSG